MKEKPKHYIHRGSRVGSYLYCRQKEHYEYSQGLTSKLTKSYFHRGTVIHAGLEEGLRCQFHRPEVDVIPQVHRGVQEAFSTWTAEMEKLNVLHMLEDEVSTMLDLCIHVSERVVCALDIHKGRFQTLATPDGKPIIELNMKIRDIPGLRPDSIMSGTIDWAAFDRESSTKWLADWKTRKAFQSAFGDRWQYQAPLYQWMLYREFGVELNGTATLQIKAEKPEVPLLLKSGKSLSKGKIKSDWPTYRKAVVDHGFDPADYIDMMDKFPEWERWDTHYRSMAECEATWNEAMKVCREIEQQLPPLRTLYPRSCSGCQFNEICAEELIGRDVSDLKAEMFRVNYRE